MHHANSNYLLSNIAVEDLTRIHQYGVKTFGTAAAEIYLDQFLTPLKKLLQGHGLLKRCHIFDLDTVVASAELTVFTLGNILLRLRLLQLLGDKISLQDFNPTTYSPPKFRQCANSQ